MLPACCMLPGQCYAVGFDMALTCRQVELLVELISQNFKACDVTVWQQVKM